MDLGVMVAGVNWGRGEPKIYLTDWKQKIYDNEWNKGGVSKFSFIQSIIVTKNEKWWGGRMTIRDQKWLKMHDYQSHP